MLHATAPYAYKRWGNYEQLILMCREILQWTYKKVRVQRFAEFLTLIGMQPSCLYLSCYQTLVLRITELSDPGITYSAVRFRCL